MEKNDVTAYNPEALPAVVVRYLATHADRDKRQAMIELFTADARVVDEGVEYLGVDAIQRWLSTAASEYNYTTELVGQEHVASDRWVVLARLEGDFPGGVADLRYRFTTRDELILDLVIAP